MHRTAKIVLSLMDEKNDETVCAVGRALSSPDRLQILRLLSVSPMNMLEISKILNLPTSSVSNHIAILQDAKLVDVKFQPAKKGHMKLCYKQLIKIEFNYPETDAKDTVKPVYVNMGVGDYVDIDIKKSGYLVGLNDYIVEKDEINSLLYTPERFEAQLLGFSEGCVTYNFPNHLIANPAFNAVELSFECCSEAPYYRNDWPSDVTVWIDDKEIVTFTCPGDFGGRKGNFSPEFWPTNATHYGLIYKISVTENGCFLNSELINKNLTIADLQAEKKNCLQVKIGIKPDAEHTGGLNLFGKNFGDYPQDIVMKFSHRT